jgi:hypothetical protein
MRAVIIGTDFMKDTDGSFKAIETNTNIALNTQWTYNPDLSEFENFVSTNNFNEIVLIYSEATNTSVNSDYTINIDYEEYLSNRTVIGYNPDGSPRYDPVEASKLSFSGYLETFCTGSNITFTKIKTDSNSITIPYVEDSDDKLIIRLTYDTTAIIDDTYAKDNWEFLKLMYDTDSDSIPKCYINDTELGIDSIKTELRDNGNHPNYCVKKRITPASNRMYPKLYKISTLEELNNLKSTLEVDEYIQEFIYNTEDVLDTRIKSYRSVDMVVGGTLDIIQLQVNETTSMMEVISSADFDDNNQVQSWDRMRYLPKFYNSTNEFAVKLSATDETKVLLPNNSVELAKNLELNNSVKSINFSTLPTSSLMLENWSASFNDTMNNYNVSSSALVNKESFEFFGIIVTINTDTNSTFSDVQHAKVMVKNNDNVLFKDYSRLNVGDTILIFDSQTETLIESIVTNVNFRMELLTGYILDFEELDLFLTLEETENQQRYGVVTHNYDYDCVYLRCGSYVQVSSYWYYRCGGWSTTGLHNNSWDCVKTNRNINSVQACGYFCGEATCWVGAINGGYCNNQKSDIIYKENLILIGKSNNGLNIYEFNYKGEDGLYQGVIAQELIGTKFETALSKNEDDLYVVDYNKIDVEFKKIK